MMTADEFWLTYRDRIQAHVAEVQYADAAHPRVAASSWEQEEAVKSAFDLFLEIGVICDRTKLRRLLAFLVDPASAEKPAGSDPYADASDLLREIGDR